VRIQILSKCMLAAAAVCWAGCATTGPDDADNPESTVGPLAEFRVDLAVAVGEQDLHLFMTRVADEFTNVRVGDKEMLRQFLASAREIGLTHGVRVNTDTAALDVSGGEGQWGPIMLDGRFGHMEVTLHMVKRKNQWLIRAMDIEA